MIENLLERRSIVRQTTTIIEEDCSQMNTQVSEFENALSLLVHEQEIASQHLLGVWKSRLLWLIESILFLFVVGKVKLFFYS